MRPYGKSMGRRYVEKEPLLEDSFENDFSKILQTKAYRRLAYKTQVLSSPDNPHVRTRLVHTNEVISLSMAISQALGLNKGLCMAIAAGHDLGHTPYGHLGEKILTEYGGKPFAHNVNSVLVAQHTERGGTGNNLTREVLEGMLMHSRKLEDLTPYQGIPQEFNAVMFADKISYVLADLNDAVRYGYIDGWENIPDSAKRLGDNQRQRTYKCFRSLVDESREKGRVDFSEGAAYNDFRELWDFEAENIYKRVDRSLQEQILRNICEYFSGDEFSGMDPCIATSLLTDSEASYFGQLLLHSVKPSRENIGHFGIFEILPNIKGKKLDYSDPDMGWEPVL